MWQDILKRVDIRNEREYEVASLDDRRRWHGNQTNTYGIRWRAMRNTQVENEDSPMYQEMVELQNLTNFHDRQRIRIRNGNKHYYSLELEGDNREKHKTKKSPQGNLMPYTELSQEVYETLSDNEKERYHIGMTKTNISQEERVFHKRMSRRLYRKLNQPTFTSSKYGGESTKNRHHTKEEYEGMTDELKGKYHKKMDTRFRRSNDKDKANWHDKMAYRLRTKSKRPTFYSQEEEQKNA